MKKGYYGIFFTLLLAGFIIQGCGSSDFMSGKMKEKNGDYKEAVINYEKELQKNPANEDAWFRLGCVKGMQMHDYEGMVAAFGEAEKLSSSHKKEINDCRVALWATHLRAGASADSANLYDKAIEEFKKSAVICPDSSLTYFFLAKAYQEKGDNDGVIACQKKIWEIDHDMGAYKLAGKLLTQSGLEKKDKFKKANAEGLRLQKDLKEIEKGSYESDVKRLLGEPDKKTKDKKNPRKMDWMYKKYGVTLTFEGEKVTNKKVDSGIIIKIDSSKYKEAVADFEKAVIIFEDIKKINPKDNENLNLLLQAYFEADRIQEAIDAFKLAVENDPGNKINHHILGILYRMINKNDTAIEEFNEAVKIDPDFSDAFYDIGATYYNWGVKIRQEEQERGDDSKSYKKKFEAALPWMIKVSEIKIKNAQDAASKEGKDWRTQLLPDDIRIWESIGTIYANLGKAKEAEKAFDEVEKIRKAFSK
jgi:tetratricopeptide (TPR) repeat protein